jgi:hypothetical protein
LPLSTIVVRQGLARRQKCWGQHDLVERKGGRTRQGERAIHTFACTYAYTYTYAYTFTYTYTYTYAYTYTYTYAYAYAYAYAYTHTIEQSHAYITWCGQLIQGNQNMAATYHSQRGTHVHLQRLSEQRHSCQPRAHGHDHGELLVPRHALAHTGLLHTSKGGGGWWRWMVGEWWMRDGGWW